MKRTLLLLFFVFGMNCLAIPAEENQAFGIRFSGFVKTDLMFDSRQTVTVREGHFLLYPAGPKLDVNGEDINAKANLNILSIQTRLKGTITGPDAFGAKTSGLIESAFFGHSDSDVNGLRLRHAILTLAWEKFSLMIGQYWHPMFVTDCFPATVSFNTGMPFQPFSRNPQIRLTYALGSVKIIAAAISQRDFTSTGPDGAGSIYLRNAAIPNMHVQLQYAAKLLLLGLGADWKTLVPQLVTAQNYKTEETVSGLSFLGYAKLNLPAFTWKLEGILGQNLTDHLMLGGYGVTSIDHQTGVETYTPTDVMSVWTDISAGKKIGVGCYAGFMKNMGAGEKIMAFYGRGSDIDQVYRVAPRIIWNSGKTQLAAELEYTGAAYGTANEKGEVENTTSVENIRLLLAAYYFF
ncbi:hypothetical protein JW935_11680 [candidate division KSB1 bacterium]|nr:hypothetical protein [candidate division KSB1 bacterium]